ncbi:MAG: ABC transporter permease [Flavobacteriaceae bacterium]|jgi:predicted hotdog family 3-hydroxylacyl-ACP dehydratase|nr:ABC transporter permease [Flavobacteriaceae bacterium]
MSNPKAIAIQNYLPHREPMLMVDIIQEITADFVSTSFVVTPDNLFVSKGQLQEVALIENAAQTCSAIVGQSFFFDEEHKEIENITVLGFISSMKKVTIFRLPNIGDQLITKATLVSKIVGDETVICVIEVEITIDLEAIFKAEINLFLQKQ